MSEQELKQKFEDYSKLREELMNICLHYANNSILMDLNDKPDADYRLLNFGYDKAEELVWLHFRSDNFDDETARVANTHNIFKQWDEGQKFIRQSRASKKSNVNVDECIRCE